MNQICLFKYGYISKTTIKKKSSNRLCTELRHSHQILKYQNQWNALFTERW